MTDAPGATPIPPPRPDNAGSWSADVVLADGGTVHVRPITVADADELVAFHDRQSRDSIYYRYFSAKARLTPAELDRFTHVDMYDRAGLVAEDGDRMIAWASYDRWPGRRDADVAFLVDDEHHGRGVATILFEHLVAIARTNGMERFTAEVLADNRGMLTVFRKAGWPLQRELESGVVEISFDLDTTDQVTETIERREQRADSRAVARLLYPRSIAVIGASEQPGSAGRAIFENLRRSYGGSLYPVNPNRPSVGGIAAYPSIEAVPELVHLAIVAVPQHELEPVLRACATHRVRGAIVITTAPDGLDLPALVAHCRRYGMRMIGPGSLGVLVAKPDVAMQATLVPGTLPAGSVGFSLQSGSLGASVLDRVQTLGMGVSTFVSLGDKADISGNDLLQFFDDDASTRVIGMYTESFGNARKFARITRRLAASKPIVAVRVRADGEGSGLDAMYQDAGVIRVDTVPEMLDTVRVLASQPLPAGDRVAIVSNSRSPLVLAKQAAEANGLLVVAEPVLAWDASPEQFADELASVLALEQVDSALVIHAPPVASAVDVPAQAIDNAARDSAKPVVAVLLGRPDGPLIAGSAVHAFEFPEQAVAVLGRAARLSSWREQEAEDGARRLHGVRRTRRHRARRTHATRSADRPRRRPAGDRGGAGGPPRRHLAVVARGRRAAPRLRRPRGAHARRHLARERVVGRRPGRLPGGAQGDGGATLRSLGRGRRGARPPRRREPLARLPDDGVAP